MTATSTTVVGTRSAGVDILRIVGITAVVVGHVWSNSVTQTAIYTWHVPLFFLLTGYFWTPGRPLGSELRKRWSTLGAPYVTWFVLIFAALVASQAATGDAAPGALLHALYGGSAATRPFSAFWFVSVLFLIAVAFRWLERFPAAFTWAVVLAGLLAAHLAPDVVTTGPLGLFLVPACLFFVLAGRLLRQVRPHLSAGGGAALLALGAVLVLTGLGAPVNIKGGDFGPPVLGVLTPVLISCGLIRLAEELDRHIGGRVAHTIGRLAACGIAVVLSHAAVLWVLHTPPGGGWFDLAAALLVPWAFAWVALGSRFSPWVTGTPRAA